MGGCSFSYFYYNMIPGKCKEKVEIKIWIYGNMVLKVVFINTDFFKNLSALYIKSREKRKNIVAKQ